MNTIVIPKSKFDSPFDGLPYRICVLMTTFTTKYTTDFQDSRFAVQSIRSLGIFFLSFFETLCRAFLVWHRSHQFDICFMDVVDETYFFFLSFSLSHGHKDTVKKRFLSR